MAPSPRDAPSDSAYDLADLADRWNKTARSRRRFLLVGSGLCFVLALAGLYLLVSAPAGIFSFRALGAWVLLVGFGLSSLYALRGSSLVGPAYRRLVVYDGGISFEGSSRGQSKRLPWNDPKFQLDIYDRTMLPSTELDGTPRVLDFVVRPRGGPRTPVPRPAFEAILSGAREHGLVVRRRPIQVGGDPVGGTLVTIAAEA